jgi:hypothetical protein
VDIVHSDLHGRSKRRKNERAVEPARSKDWRRRERGQNARRGRVTRFRMWRLFSRPLTLIAPSSFLCTSISLSSASSCCSHLAGVTEPASCGFEYEFVRLLTLTHDLCSKIWACYVHFYRRRSWFHESNTSRTTHVRTSKDIRGVDGMAALGPAVGTEPPRVVVPDGEV